MIPEFRDDAQEAREKIMRRRACFIAKKVQSRMAWVVEILNERVEAGLQALPEDLRASFLHISRFIEHEGLPNVHEPYVKHLEGPLWEMRRKGKMASPAQRMSLP